MRRAKELIFSATPFTAEQAERWGMVNRVCPDDSLLSETIALATQIAANAPLSVIQAKKSINSGAGTDLRTALLIEIEAYNRLVLSEDRHEGVRAFNEKRPADFKGV
jgi:enoyl-CoA hydratase/carnithine racemase